MPQPVRVFAYWEGYSREAPPAVLSDFLAEWQTAFEGFEVVGDAEIIEQLADFGPEAVALYRRLRFSNAKSDVARFVNLYAHGGLYIDCHCGLRDRDAMLSMFELLQQYELVLWDRSQAKFPRPEAEWRPMIGAVLARPRSPAVARILTSILENLRQAERDEQRRGPGTTEIWYCTGAGAVRAAITKPRSKFTKLRRSVAGRITRRNEDDCPIQLYRHTRYRNPDTHWSKRQKREYLLAPE